MPQKTGTIVLTRVAKIKLAKPANAEPKAGEAKETTRSTSCTSEEPVTAQTTADADPIIKPPELRYLVTYGASAVMKYSEFGDSSYGTFLVRKDKDVARKHGIWSRSVTWWTSRTWWPHALHWASLLLIGGALWGVVYSMTEGSFLPGTQLFSLLTLFVTSYLIGQVAVFCHLPALLGMLLTGIAFRNAGFIHISGDFVQVSAVLREIALCVILTRAGLGLDPTALKSLSLMIFRLAAVPSLVEGAFTTVLTHYLLGLPWIWGVLLGAILAAVSPAVVIPCLFSLQERGYGKEKGIPTLIVAAASFDDILAISVFGVILGVIFSVGDVASTIIQGPLGVVIGVVFGLVWGAVATQVPHKDDSHVVALRSLMVGGGGLVAILGSVQLGYQGAGPLGCIVLAFVACLGWRKQGWNDKNNPVGRVFEGVWAVFQPILFGLIGSEVDVTVLEGSVIGYGALSLLIALFARIVISVFIAFGAGFNWKEKMFVAWAWFPKATVQAALGPVALDIARKSGTVEEQGYANIVLIVAVLAILLTAPAGAIIITLLGPRLLTKEAAASVRHSTHATVDNTSAESSQNN